MNIFTRSIALSAFVVATGFASINLAGAEDVVKPLKPDAMKTDAMKPVKPDAMKADAMKPVKPDAMKADAMKPVKPDAMKADAMKPVKPDAKKPLKKPDAMAPVAN